MVLESILDGEDSSPGMSVKEKIVFIEAGACRTCSTSSTKRDVFYNSGMSGGSLSAEPNWSKRNTRFPLPENNCQ